MTATRRAPRQRQDAVTTPSAPSIGEADLTNCEREQIQFARSIQPHGALLVVREPDHTIVQSSVNARDMLQLDSEPLGMRLDDLCPGLAARLHARLDTSLDDIPVAVHGVIGQGAPRFDMLAHRLERAGLVIEFEPAAPRVVHASSTLHTALSDIAAAPSLRRLCGDAARIFKSITGYDRVMVYRFDTHGHGEVLSEEREPDLEPYLGNRYPASDIPQIARRLYLRNRVRVLVDVEYEPVAIEPTQCPVTGTDLDMSLCFLRSMSPIHLQYLRNMGVRATLVASIEVGGKLWGLVACHHYVPRHVPYETRAVCEMLAENLATRVAAMEAFAHGQAELSVRRLEQRMIDAIAREGDWRPALFHGSDALLSPLDAAGGALVFDRQVLTSGEVPGTPEIRAIAEKLDQERSDDLYVTASLGKAHPEFAALTPVASGLVAAPLSDKPGEYLLWFRPERVRTVTWGGDPSKPVIIGDDPRDLSPRRSFAQWHELVEGTSDEWTSADLVAASLIRESVMDVILQFRSVRMLILETQVLDEQERIGEAAHPVAVADAQGRILLANHAFNRAFSGRRPHLQWITDLPSLFAEPESTAGHLEALLRNWRPWRAEVSLNGAAEGGARFLLRADPVFASSSRVLGFVLMFTDLSERKAAEAARRRFQESVIETRALHRTDAATPDALGYRALETLIMENAQLAALEITDGIDPRRMPVMLEGVRASVARCAGLLDHLNSYRDDG